MMQPSVDLSFMVDNAYSAASWTMPVQGQGEDTQKCQRESPPKSGISIEADLARLDSMYSALASLGFQQDNSVGENSVAVSSALSCLDIAPDSVQHRAPTPAAEDFDIYAGHADLHERFASRYMQSRGGRSRQAYPAPLDSSSNLGSPAKYSSRHLPPTCNSTPQVEAAPNGAMSAARGALLEMQRQGLTFSTIEELVQNMQNLLFEAKGSQEVHQAVQHAQMDESLRLVMDHMLTPGSRMAPVPPPAPGSIRSLRSSSSMGARTPLPGTPEPLGRIPSCDVGCVTPRLATVDESLMHAPYACTPSPRPPLAPLQPRCSAYGIPPPPPSGPPPPLPATGHDILPSSTPAVPYFARSSSGRERRAHTPRRSHVSRNPYALARPVSPLETTHTDRGSGLSGPYSALRALVSRPDAHGGSSAPLPDQPSSGLGTGVFIPGYRRQGSGSLRTGMSGGLVGGAGGALPRSPRSAPIGLEEPLSSFSAAHMDGYDSVSLSAELPRGRSLSTQHGGNAPFLPSTPTIRERQPNPCDSREGGWGNVAEGASGPIVSGLLGAEHSAGSRDGSSGSGPFAATLHASGSLCGPTTGPPPNSECGAAAVAARTYGRVDSGSGIEPYSLHHGVAPRMPALSAPVAEMCGQDTTYPKDSIGEPVSANLPRLKPLASEVDGSSGHVCGYSDQFPGSIDGSSGRLNCLPESTPHYHPGMSQRSAAPPSLRRSRRVTAGGGPCSAATPRGAFDLRGSAESECIPLGVTSWTQDHNAVTIFIALEKFNPASLMVQIQQHMVVVMAMNADAPNYVFMMRPEHAVRVQGSKSRPQPGRGIHLVLQKRSPGNTWTTFGTLASP